MEKKSSDKILAHGSLMFLATNAANACNFSFHFVMGRMLGRASYGEVNSLISLFFIFGVPAIALQTVITKYVASFKAKGEYGKASYLISKFTRTLLVYAAVGFLLFVAGSRMLVSFLKISSTWPVIALGLVVLVGALLPIGRGTLQGLQSFWHLGVNLMVDGVLRFLLAMVLVYFGLGVTGAIGAQVVSGIIALSLLVFPLRFLAKEKPDPAIDLGEIYRYFWPVVISLLCFNVLTQIDIVLVKHFFHPAQAGDYSSAAKVGSIVLFLPAAIATVMFPKISEARALDRDPRSILRKSLLTVGALCGFVAIGYFLFPSLPVSILYGSKFMAAASLVGLFGVAMTFFALLNILLFYHLSTTKFTFLYFLVIFTCIHVLLLWFFHGSLAQVVTIMSASAFVLCIINWLLAYPEKIQLLRSGTEL